MRHSRWKKRFSRRAVCFDTSGTEVRAVLDVLLDDEAEAVAGLEPVLVEPDVHTRRIQCVGDFDGNRMVFVGVAQEDRIRFEVPGRLDLSSVTNWGMARCGVLRLPPSPELTDELHGIPILVRPHFAALEKHREVPVGARGPIRYQAAACALCEEQIALRCTQREAGQPSGQAAAQDQEVPVFQQIRTGWAA